MRVNILLQRSYRKPHQRRRLETKVDRHVEFTARTLSRLKTRDVLTYAKAAHPGWQVGGWMTDRSRK